MRYYAHFLLTFSLIIIGCKKKKEYTSTKKYRLSAPAGKIYHNAYPDFHDTEDQVSSDSIIHFESLAKKSIGWVYFSNNWLPSKGGIVFPHQAVRTIHSLHKTPYIRMMARSQFEEGVADPLYTMDVFLQGRFNNDIRNWARAAKSYNFPLLVEFGTEMNGFWFPWNGYWNGAGNTDSYGDPSEYDGPEKFKDVYRHIIDICREEGVNNIIWFFHVNAENDPVTNWNKMKYYYPGDDYIDWIGISVYGSLEYTEPWRSFHDILSDNWNEISNISNAGKPIAILEWGIYENPAIGNKAQWINNAVQSVLRGAVYSGKISAMSYWNESWDDDGEIINLRIDSSPQALQAYRHAVSNSMFISDLKFQSN